MNLESPSFPVHEPHPATGPSQDAGSPSPRAVEACLPFGGMTLVPAAFDRFARAHFHRSPMKSVSWPDACPAYALAWLTHAAYGPALDAADEWELRLQWQDLHGGSNLSWREARAILRDAWAWLSRHEQAVAPAGAA